MKDKIFKTEHLNLKIETDQLSSTQIRLIKSLNSMMMHVLTTDKEDEFFDSSADLMRMCAALIKQSHFSEINEIDSIPYGEQALEYSVDILKEHMDQSKIISYDN